jgi:hypothetical protein
MTSELRSNSDGICASLPHTSPGSTHLPRGSGSSHDDRPCGTCGLPTACADTRVGVRARYDAPELRERTLEITFLKSGTEAYVFTFG